jgi:cytochrome c-type biogenesis protein
MTDVNIFLAFGAGVLSFISPCCLPLYPAFLSYITGLSVNELKQENGMMKKRALIHTSFFLVGFSLIFVLLGMSTSFLGSILFQYKDLVRQIGGILIVFFGLVVLGILKPSFLMKDKKITFQKRPSGYLGSILIGMGFAAGWTPCTGPILAGVIALSMSNPGTGLVYMLAYVLGFAVPFFVMSFFLGSMTWIRKYNHYIIRIGGGLMIIMGIFLYFDWMTKITSYLINLYGGFQGF